MEIITRLNWVDFLAIIICFRISYIGLQDGLSHGIFPLIASVCTLVISLHYYDKLPFLSSHLIAFIILLICLSFIFKLIRAVVDSIIKVTWHPLIEKFGGFLIGLARAAVVTSTILILIALMPFSYLQWSIRDKSLTGMYFVRIGPQIHERVLRFLPALKGESANEEQENLLHRIMQNKSIDTKPEKKQKKAPEWEKALEQ